jgi:predicted AAA+ superfamily ATPase
MVKIIDIINQNPWWNKGKEFVLTDLHLRKAKPIFFSRRELDLKKGDIHILRGCRQIGKTTYLKNLVKNLIERGTSPRNILYFSLDFFTSRREMRNALNYFLDATQDAEESYIFLDEITFLKDWNLELKYIADSGIIGRCTIVATGSSAVGLREKGELLPGRGVEGNESYIKPLSFRQFVLHALEYLPAHMKSKEFQDSLERLRLKLLKSQIDLASDMEITAQAIDSITPFRKEIQYLFKIYVISGGIPAIINRYLQNRFEDEKEMIESTLSEIFVRDVLGDLARLQRQETVVRDILKGILERYGSRYSFSKLSTTVGRTHVTVIDSLEILRDSFILLVLYAYDFVNKDMKLKGDKKVYFIDPFIYHSIKSYLSGEEVWDTINKTLIDENLQGMIGEGIVLSHLLMHMEIPYAREGSAFLWYHYDRSGKEIDAVMKAGDKYLGLEVKYRTNVDRRDVRRISDILEYILLSKDDIEFGKNVLIAPMDLFLSLLPVSGRNI